MTHTDKFICRNVQEFPEKDVTSRRCAYYVGLHRSEPGGTNAKKIVNIRLRPDQEARINAIVERSAILDTSKFVRIAVDWLLRSDIGEVIKTIVDDEAYPDYAMPKKTTGRKNKARSKRTKKA
jgi:hypothetical protein